MTVHANSLEAFRTLDRRARSEAILTVYRDSMRPLTDRQVMEALGFHDANAVRPRITELLDAGKLCEVESAKDHVTGKTVRCCTNTTMGDA